jgi:hypothetical protein
MKSITNGINLVIISLFVVAPFAGYLTRRYIDADFSNIINFISVLSVILLLIMRSQLVFPTYLIFLLLFTLYTIISDLLLVGKELNFKYIYTNGTMGSLMVIFLVENTYFPKKFMDYALKISSFILVIAFLVILIQQFYDITFFVNPVDIEGLTNSMFTETRLPSIYSWIGGLYILGLCYFPVMAIVVGDALKSGNNNISSWHMIMGAITAFISKSRFIMLNYIVLVFLIPIYRRVDFFKVVKFSLYVIVICGSIYLGSKQIGFDMDKILSERIFETKSQDIRHSTAGTRLLAIQIFEKLFPENPLFGKGRKHYTPKNSTDYELLQELQGRSSQIHVGYLSLFYYYGIVGGSLFLAFTIATIVRMYKTAKKTLYWGPVFGFGQLVIYNFTGVILNFMIMGIILCYVFDKYYRDMEEDLTVAIR